MSFVVSLIILMERSERRRGMFGAPRCWMTYVGIYTWQRQEATTAFKVKVSAIPQSCATEAYHLPSMPLLPFDTTTLKSISILAKFLGLEERTWQIVQTQY
jgi:hypothetical protein